MILPFWMKAASLVLLAKEKDPKMSQVFADAYGYAVFPTVGKGGIGIGAALTARASADLA